jgi:UDP-N-acetylenolpyruvoylglucosamine reductase
MNANAYGGELARVLEWVDIVTGAGTTRREPAELGFAYRRSALGPSEVVARASFRLKPAPPVQVKATLNDLQARRRAAQPAGVKTFGSTFKNPDGGGGRTAGQLLDEAGCRGLRVGGAGFSEKHANFIVNLGDATAKDVLLLMDRVRAEVEARFGVRLQPEVKIWGENPYFIF